MRYADAKCTYTESFEDGQHVYIFTGPCQVTGKTYSVKVKGEELYAYRRGALAQNAFKTLSAEDREFLISGTSPDGWKQMYGGEDGEESGN